MRSFQILPEPGGQDLEQVRQAAAHLKGQACTVAARHISDGMLRLQFNREVAYYAQGIIRDVESGESTVEKALASFEEHTAWMSHPAARFAENSAGLAGGVGQVATGATLCYASAASLCFPFGLALISHGGNNIYENGRNLIYNRSDSEGWVRQGYQKAAQMLGGSKRMGNIAYYSTDLTLSFWGLSRQVVSPTAWKLFKCIDSDYVRGGQAMSKEALRLEIIVDVYTGKNLTLEFAKEDE